jgi:hypothetical protein
MPDLVDMDFYRPKEQWWTALQPVMDMLAAEPSA